MIVIPVTEPEFTAWMLKLVQHDDALFYGDIGVAVSTAVCGTASRGANPLCLPNQMSNVRGQIPDISLSQTT